MQRHRAQHTPDFRVDQRVEQAPQRRLAARYGRGENLGRHDLEAGIGVDHQALLVAGDDLELLGFVVEQSAVDALDILDQRNLGVEPGLGLGLADDGAELADQDLLGRVDGVERLRDQEGGNGQEDHDDDRTVAHRVAPCGTAPWAGWVCRAGWVTPCVWFDRSSGNGR